MAYLSNSVVSLTGPNSLVVRVSASGAVDRGLAPRSRHTKGVKNGTISYLADARKVSIRYLLCRKIAHELMLSVRNNKASLSLSNALSVTFQAHSEILVTYEPRCEKTGLRGFRPGPTQTRKMARGLKFCI